MKALLPLAALAATLMTGLSGLHAQNQAPRPVALIMCNWKYQHLAPLLTPEADAEAMRRALESLSPAYEVTVVSNATSEEMRKAISSFTALHKGNPVVLVYTSGHGLQVGGTNYLAGVDASLEEFEKQGRALREAFPDDVQFRAQVEAVKSNFARKHLVSVDDLIARLGGMGAEEAGGAQVKMVFMDACREAFPDLEADSLAVTKSLFGGKGAGGLARVTERPGIFVGMSAAANQVSQQNDRDRLVVKASLQPEVSALGAVPFLWRHYRQGGNAADIVEGALPPSLFTERLTAEIAKGGSPDQVFSRTGAAVQRDTEALLKAGRVGLVQTPAKYSLYYGDYEFPPHAVADKTNHSGVVGPGTVTSGPATSGPAMTDAPTVELPFGIPIPGRPGMVNSPFAAKHQLVDVTGLPVGMEVKCPYTGKLFRVPSQDAKEIGTPAPQSGTLGEPGSKPSVNPSAPDSTTTSIPYGEVIPGRPGFVHSPFTADKKMIDVRDMAPGTRVLCPYTQKVFRVP